MGILSDKTRHVTDLDRRIPLVIREQRVQGSRHSILSSHESRKPKEVMRSEEAILPRNTLHIIPGTADWIERRHPVPFRCLAAHETSRGIENVHVALRPGEILVCQVLLAKFLGHSAYAPVVVSEFQSLGDGASINIGRNKAEGVVGLRALIRVRSDDHGLQRLLEIERTKVQPCVSDHRDRMIADHAIGLRTGQGPLREPATFLCHVHKTEHHVIDKRLVDDRHQRIPTAECVPKGESRIEGLSFGNFGDLLTEITVTAINVVTPVRDHHAMVKG